VLKFEKMLLMQMHARRMHEIESALSTIQLQKTNSASTSQHHSQHQETKERVPDRFTFGTNQVSKSFCVGSDDLDAMKNQMIKRL
jgi:hypothetical protein